MPDLSSEVDDLRQNVGEMFMNSPGPAIVNMTQKAGQRMQQWAGAVEKAANDAGLDAAFVSRLVGAESNWNPVAVSKAGARGLMQLMPATAKQYGVTDLFNPIENIKAGIGYLKDLAAKYGPDRPDLIAAAYNAGPGAVEKHGGVPPYKETQAYVRKVAGPSAPDVLDAQGNPVQANSAPDVLDLGGQPANEPHGAMNTALEVAKGAGKSLLRSGIAGGALLRAIPGVDAAANALPSVNVNVQNENTAQRVGGAIETGAEIAAPLAAGAKLAIGALPSTARAGRTFQEVMGAAKNIPVDVGGTGGVGDIALRIKDLADRGGTLPKAVNDFLKYATDPKRPAMTYEVARDFASNISRLSRDEMGKLTPVVLREVSGLRMALNQAVGEAAAVAGKSEEYWQAMREYAHASKMRDAIVQGMKKYGIPATAIGAGSLILNKVLHGVGESLFGE